MPYKVIIQGTGFVGKMVIRELASHPDFEIVGCIVNDPAKDGRDAGEIAGIGPIGVKATTDIDAALAVPADALAHFGPTAAFAAQNIDHMTRALRAGKNVVSTAMTPLIYPKACTGDARKTFMKGCLGAGADSQHAALTPQQQKMKDCNAFDDGGSADREWSD